MTIKSFRICCSVSLVASCLGLDSRTQAHSLLSLINSHWTSVLCLDATGTPELARVTLQCIQPLKATGRKPKEPISGKQGRHHDSGFRGAPRDKLALIFVDLMRFPGKQFGFAWFQREIWSGRQKGREGWWHVNHGGHILLGGRGNVLQPCWEMSLESQNLVVLCLDSGCAWSEWTRMGECKGEGWGE